MKASACLIFDMHTILAWIQSGFIIVGVLLLLYSKSQACVIPTSELFLAKALLSPTTRMEDVFFGLYYWLQRHPLETVLVSMNQEAGTGTPNDASLQEKVYRILTSELAKEYWMQNSGNVRFSLMIKFLYIFTVHTSGRFILWRYFYLIYIARDAW
jgi:hypothetical protein